MKQRSLILILAAAGLAGLTAFAWAQSASVLNDGITPTKSIWAGVFTEAQAKRGEGYFIQFHCGYCHHPDMSGDVSEGVSPLRGDHFMVNWDSQPLSDFVRRIHVNPSDQSNDMDIQTATDITAYILAANSIPYGKTDLPADTAALATFRWDQVAP